MARWAESVPVDIVVFPELASCGYMYENRKEAEPYVEGLTALRTIERVAQSTGRLIVGGFAERAGRTLYDSAFAAGPSGTTVYRKIHLWNRETLIFVAVVNRTGVERGAHFPGQSSLTNPFGQLESLDDREGILVKSLDFSLLKTAKRPNAFNDLDHDSKLRILPPK